MLTPQWSGNFIFPVADGTVKICGGEQRLRTSTFIRERPERGEEQDNLRGESDGVSSPTPHQDDSARDDAEAKHDFWWITKHFINRHHVDPGSERRIISNSAEVHRPLPEQHIHHWMYCWRKYWWLLDVDGERELQDSFYWTKGHLTDIHGPVRRLTRNQTTSRPDKVGQLCGSICRMQQKRMQSKNGLSRSQSLIMPDNCKESSSLNQMTKNSNSQWKPLVESWKFRCQQQCLAKYP